MKTIAPQNRAVAAVIMTVLLGTTLAALWLAYAPQPEPSAGLTGGVGQPSGAPAIGGPFTLTDDADRTVTEANLVGEKYHLIFFGFANCPDVCPGMLQLMAGVEEKLPAATKAKLQFVFVSVDPDRDSLTKLGEYVRGFSPSFVGWTGSKEQIDVMVKNYLAYYAKRPDAQAPDGYSVDHSGFAYLMGPDGKYVTHFRSSDSATSLQAGLINAIR
ncbi:MAG: SCO family protein [Alphaproteobacteria bacterium]|nr:SCO family protein [Alphaproteobacteria bacterium]